MPDVATLAPDPVARGPHDHAEDRTEAELRESAYRRGFHQGVFEASRHLARPGVFPRWLEDVEHWRNRTGRHRASRRVARRPPTPAQETPTMPDDDHEFRYRIGGHLEPAPGVAPADDWGKAGWSNVINWGEQGGLELSVWKSDGARWLLSFSGPCEGCVVEVAGWPAFLDALRHFAPAVGLSQREQVNYGIEKLCRPCP